MTKRAHAAELPETRLTHLVVVASLRVFSNEFVVEGEKLGVHLAHQRHVAQDSRVLSLHSSDLVVQRPTRPHAFITTIVTC